ncbi:hypothetical protein SGFS_077830 [Streptomyces graminofaciens]|uniref:Secreted protein n=1 Tax=Streptomyces graminofaciens TaxID=68212 RepID=A0ABN5VSV1_9ACTN|nr:hypothetical protein [Streptomyces graminofaciens]BBC36489.1 hypothetical protein SGFS_077830 [Streptomyces graminofaciens]
MRRTTPTLALALSALLLAPLPARAAAGHPSGSTLGYGTKATYAPRQNARTHQRPPGGFVPVFTENVSRHGSRSAPQRSSRSPR